MSETATTSKLRTINPEDLAQFTERVNIDPNANAFARPVPIPDGKYQAQLTRPTSKEGTEARPILQGGTNKNGEDYFFGNCEVKILASAQPDISNDVLKGKAKTMRYKATSFEKTDPQGLNTNEMAGVIYATGLAPASDLLGDLGAAWIEVVNNGAKVGVITQWQAGHMVPVTKDGKTFKNWEIVRRGMTSFPKNYTTLPDGTQQHDGTYNPTITYNGEELTARAEVVGFFRL